MIKLNEKTYFPVVKRTKSLGKFTEEDYRRIENLREERRAITESLRKNNGSLDITHKQLCPGNFPYSFSAFRRRIIKHGVNYKNYRLLDPKEFRRQLEEDRVREHNNNILSNMPTKEEELFSYIKENTPFYHMRLRSCSIESAINTVKCLVNSYSHQGKYVRPTIRFRKSA